MSESASGCRREISEAQSREDLEDEEKHEDDERNEEIEQIEKKEKNEKTEDADPIDRSDPEPERVENVLSQKPTESEKNLEMEAATETETEKRDAIPNDNNEPDEDAPVHQPDRLDLVEDIDEGNQDRGEEIPREGPFDEPIVEYIEKPDWRMIRDKDTIEDADILADSMQCDDSREPEPDSEVEQDHQSQEIPSDRAFYNFIYANNLPWETEESEKSEDEPDGDENSDPEDACELPLPDPVPEVTETTSDPPEKPPSDHSVDFIQSDESHWSNLAPEETTPKTSPLKSENQDTFVMTSPKQNPSEADAMTDSPSDQNLRSDPKAEIWDINKSDLLPTMPSPETLLRISQHLEFDEDTLEIMSDFLTMVRFDLPKFRWKEETIASGQIPEFQAHCQAIRDETIKSDMVMIKKGHVFYSEGYVRCSSLHVKYLTRGAVKAKLWPKLDQANYFTHFSADSKPLSQGGKIPDVLLALPKSAKALHYVWKMNEPPKRNADAHDQWTTSKPGHQAVERYLYQQLPQTLAIETPIWDEHLQITGHIDLLIQDGKTLYVVDYKPEADRDHEYRFIKTLPQVSMYGKLMQKMVPNDIQVKCVSFSQDHAWVYDPRLMRETLVAAILPHAINKEAVKENIWIPISQDQRAPMAKLPQGRVNHYFQKILETPSTSSYMRNYRRILHQLQAGKDLIEQDAVFIRNGLHKKFNLSQSYLGMKMDDFLLEYQKKFQEPELRDKFYSNIIAGNPLSESMDKYLQSKFAIMSRGGLRSYFARFRAFSRQILQKSSIDLDKFAPFLREIHDKAAKTDKQILSALDEKWKEQTIKQDRIPIGKYPSINIFMRDNMALGRNLTEIKQELLKLSPKTEYKARVAYFNHMVKQILHEDREKAQKIYSIPLTWRTLTISVQSDETVKISERVNINHLEKQLEGLTSSKYYEKMLGQNLPIDQITEKIFSLVMPEERDQRFVSFLYTFRNWAKSHPEYLFEHFRIPKDAPYQIKNLDNSKISVELRLTEFCHQNIAQGIPMEMFAQEGLDQCTPDRQRIKWHEMCTTINRYAQGHPQRFEKTYGIPVNEQFSAAKYLTGKVSLAFDKQARQYTPPFKYNFDGKSLKMYVLSGLSDSPKRDLDSFLQTMVDRYPTQQHDMQIAFRRHVNLWIETHPDHPQRDDLHQNLLRTYDELQATPMRVQLYKDILANRPVEVSKELFRKSYLVQIGKPMPKPTLNTYLSRMRHVIQHRITHPKCTIQELRDLRRTGHRTFSPIWARMVWDTPLTTLRSLTLISPEPSPRAMFYTELLQNHTLKACKEQYQTRILEKTGQPLLKMTINDSVSRVRNLINFRTIHPKCSLETIKGQFKATLPHFVQEQVFRMSPESLAKLHVNRTAAIATHDAALIDKYMHVKYLAPKRSPKSTADTRQKIHQFYHFLKTRYPALYSIQSLSSSHYEGYLAYLTKEKKLTGKSLGNFRSQIHRYLTFSLPEFAQKHPTSTAHLSPIPSRDQPFIDTFLQENYITPGKSQNTLTKARRAVTDYYTFLRQDFPDFSSVTTMDTNHLDDFAAHLTEKLHQSEATAKKKARMVKKYLDQLA